MTKIKIQHRRSKCWSIFDIFFFLFWW